jgi:hypothetical protein
MYFMSDGRSFLGLMVDDHLKARALIKECEQKITEQDPTLFVSFVTLKESLEKHMLLEEEFLSRMKDRDPQSHAKISDLMREHTLISRFLEHFEQMLVEGKRPNFNEFLSLLSEHEEDEERFLYRNIDRGLIEGEWFDASKKLTE